MNSSAAQKLFCLALLFTVGINLGQARTNAPAKPAFVGSLHPNDPEFERLVPSDARAEVIARGYRWAEGLAWCKSGQYLVFSDVARHQLYMWQEGHRVKPFPGLVQANGKKIKRGGCSVDGIELDAQEYLVLAGHADRRVVRVETNLTLTTLVNQYQGKRLNSPNDLAHKSNGDLYFTDPPYGLPGKNDSPARELSFNGVYRLTPNGELTLLIKDLVWPNGIALSPDENILYVANADPKKAVWMAYDVKPDGTVGRGRVFYDITAKAALQPAKGLPNGMEVDKDGNLFASGPGGVYVFNPAGKLLGMIRLNVPTTNCTFGDDGSTLYITTASYVCRIKTATRGADF
jgi:gluconolactonase